MIFKKNTLFTIGLLIKRLVCLARARFFARAFAVFLVLVVTSFVVLTAVVNISGNRVNKAYAATSSTINFQARLLNSSGNVVPDGNYHIEFKLYNANNTTGSSQGSCSGDSNCLWTETRTTGNLVRVVNGYLTVNLGSVTAFPSTINWDQEHWLGMRVGGSSGSAAWETIEMTSDGTATGGKLKFTAVPYALRAGGLQSTSGANALKLNLATPTANVTYTLQDAAAGNYDLCTTATVCTGYAPSSGGSTYIQNTTSLQSAANFNIQSAASGSVGGVIRGATSQTADLFQLQDSSGVILTAFSASGQLVFGPSGSQDTNLYRSAANTLKTDDDLAVGSNLTISASGNITQTGATTISTGTGAISLNGATSVTGTNTLTVGTGATSLGGSLGVSGNTILSGPQFTNNGSTLYTAIAITDKPSGGNIGTAATTVDVATTFNVNQTTASQTLTLPNPTSATSGRIAYVNNVGSAGFTMGGLTISASSSGTFIWNGSTWVAGNVSSGVASVGAIDSQTKSANGAVIAGSTIYLQNADATYPGLVSVGTQTFAGAKTFNNDIVAAADLAINGGDLTTDQTTFNLLNSTATTVNAFGAASTLNLGPTGATATSVNLAGGSGATGCTVDGATGNLACSGNITGATTGTIGYWSRSGTTLQPATAGDDITTSGNISTTGTGTITSAGLLTGSAGLTVSGGTANINASGTSGTSIGNATGTLTLTGSSSSTIVLNGVTISATELNYLDGHDAALVDTNDAVNTAITGTGALTTGSIASGFGTIATANTITGTTLNGTTGINTGAGAGTQRIDASGNLLNIGNVTTSGASTFQTTGATGFTFKPGTDNTTAFQIQNAGGTQLFNIDSTSTTNLITNNNFETNTSGWSVVGTSTLTQDGTQYLYGAGSMKVDSVAAGDGTKYAYSLASSTSYVFSVYVKSTTNYLKERIEIGRADDGSTNTACTTYSTTVDNVSGGWTRYFCKFTTGTTSGSPYVYIKHNTSVLDFFVDGAQLEQTTSGEPSPYSFGKLTLNAQIASPLYIQPTQNSSSVFQIQNTASETLLNVASDTLNMLENSSFENGSASPWVAMGSATLSAPSHYEKFIGDKSLKIATTASSGDGAKYPITLESNTTYIFSFYSNVAMQNNTEVGYSSDGSTDSPCMRSPYSPGSERFMCQFTTGTVSGSPYIYLKTTAGTSSEYNIDGVQLQKINTATASYWYAPDDFEIDTTSGFVGLLGTETINWSTTQANSPTHSMSVDTPASADAGINVYGTLESYKQYHVSFWARLDSGTFNTFQFGYHDGDTTYTNCATGQTVSTGSWTKFNCFFNTGAMPYGWNGFMYWRQSDATARTFYIDDITIITQDEDSLADTPYTGNVRLSVGKPAIDSKYTLDVGGSLGVDGYIYVSGTRFNSTHLSDTQDLARLPASQTFTGDNTFAGASTLIQAGTDNTLAFSVKNVAGTTLFNVNTSGKTINIGSTSTTNSASTVNISTTTNSATAQVVNIGSTATNTSNITKIQGGSDTTQAIQLVPNAAGGIMIGASNGTGTITLGRSTGTNTVSIGSGNPSSATQTINIGNGTVSGSGGINVNILSGSAGSVGTSTLNLGDSDRVTQIDIGNVVADSARTINMGTGNSTAVDTLNIGTGNTTVAGGKTINIGSGTPTGSGTNLITIGTLTNASTTTIYGGTGSGAVSIQAASGATIQMGTSAGTHTSIGNATGTLTLTGSSSSTIVLNGVTISATELNYLDGHDAALVDTNDAVNTAITGTGALTTGSIASGFGTIATANNITTSANISTSGTGTITSAGLLTGQAGLTVTGAAVSLNDSSNFATNINTGTSTGAVSVGNGSAGAVAIQSGSTVGITSGTSLTLTSGGSSNIVLNSAGLIDLQDNVDVTGSTAFKRGADFSTTGTSNNVNFGEVSLVRLTGASAQTITGIANGRDGEILTIVNAAGQSATISNNSGSSSSGNQIISGTGANITLPAGGSITLVYDAASPGYWRVVGNVAFSTGNYIQNGTTQQTSANFNIQSASAGSVGAVIQGATSQTADILQLKDEDGDNLLAVGANAGFAVQSSNGFTSTSAFTVGIAGGATIFRVNSTTPGVHTGSTTFGVFNDTATTINAFGAANTINMGAAGASIVNPGSLSLQATGTNTLTLNTTGAGTVNLGTTNTTTIGIGNTTAATAVTIQGGTGASALSLQAGSGGTINVGTLNNNNVAINTAAVAGTTIIGGTGTTGTITLGQSTATNTINIGANIGASATQTINIGTSATASSTTNVNVGSAIGTSATNIRAGTSGVTVYQSATSATALKIQNAASESLFTAGDDGGGSSIRLDNAYLYLAGVPTPVSPTLSSSGTGGSLTANTYYYRVSSYDSTGLVSTAIATSPASATTTGSSSRNTISWTQVSGATGYAVDRSTNGGVTWYRNDVGNVASIIDNGVTYTWSGSDYGSHGRINYSASVTLQSGGAVFLDTTGNVSLNKNNATGDIELTNLGSGGGVNLTGSDFQYTDNTSFENLFTISSTGDATFRTQTGSNSATAFQIQNATGADTMFTVDNSTTNKVKIGNSTGTGTSTTVFQLDGAASAPFSTGQTAYLGSMYYDTTQGKLQCYEDRNGTATWGACGSAPNNIVTLTPEYTGAVLNGTGTGTMTADFCSNESGVLTVGSLCANHEARNFYKWTSPQSTDQTYSIYVTYKLPSTFNSFDSSSTIKLTALSDNTTNASATLQVFRKNVSGNTISSCGSATTINNTANTWQQTSFGGDETACGFVGGDYVIFKINVTAKSSGNIYVENLDFTFRNN